MSGDNDQTTTQKAEPWSPMQGYLKDAALYNQQAFQSGGLTPQPLGGSMSDETLRSMQMISNQANAGAPNIDRANGYLGTMMDPYGYMPSLAWNPGEQMAMMGNAIQNDVMDDVIPSAVSQFAGSGMGNSTLAMDTVGDAASTAVTNAIAPYWNAALDRSSANFNAAADRGMTAAQMAPGMEMASYMPAQMLGQVGSQIDSHEEAMANAPIQGFNNYLANIMGLGGMGSTGSYTKPGPSTGQQIAAGGLTGLGAYGALAGASVPFAGPLAIGAGLLGML